MDAPWLYDYKSEFGQFSPDDSHRHDDQIDATLDAIEHMLVVGNYKKPPEDKVPKHKPIAPPMGTRTW